jgi:hypothetical protein
MSQDDLPPMPDVPRDDVHRVIKTMLRDAKVRWAAVVFQAQDAAGVDLFTVTPYTKDPTV